MSVRYFEYYPTYCFVIFRWEGGQCPGYTRSPELRARSGRGCDRKAPTAYPPGVRKRRNSTPATAASSPVGQKLKEDGIFGLVSNYNFK